MLIISALLIKSNLANTKNTNMKQYKILLLPFLTLIFCTNVLWAQCPQDSIILFTQAEVDSFAIIYPDCTGIEGNLMIGNPPYYCNINDLSPLNQITSIGGDLRVYRSSLSNFSGLENVVSIEGNLLIERNNPNFSSLSGLENLTSIGGDLLIERNYNLINLTDLEDLTSIGGDLNISQNSLDSLVGLENITTVRGNLSIESNGNLRGLSGLENLTSIEGGLSIVNNDNLKNLNSLGNITLVKGNLRITDNLNLDDLNGLNKVTTIGGDVWISSTGLINLSGLNSLTSIGGELWIFYNQNLNDLNDLENLTSIGGKLEVMLNNNLVTLNGLKNVTSIGGSLNIYGNDRLVNLTGLENIQHNTISELYIKYNNMLSTCNLPNICTYLQNGGPLEIFNNAPDCNSSGEILALCTVPVTTPDDSPQFTISPNPSTGIFKIQGISQGTYQVHDVVWRIIQKGELKNDLSIDMSQETKGVYFLSIQVDDNEVITKRITKF